MSEVLTMREVLSAVAQPCLAYVQSMAMSELPRALMAGTRGMKAAGKTFLLQHALETDEAYAKRLEQSTLLNAFKKTCVFLAGQIFQSDVIFADDVPEEVLTMCDDIDGKGNSIHLFSKRVFINGLGTGASHILIEAPSVKGQVLTQQEEAAQGIRPYFREVKMEDIIGYRIIDGKLDNLRIKETAALPDGQFGEKLVNRIRVYYSTGAWEVWQEGKDGIYNVVESGILSYKGIPLVSFVPGEEWTNVSGETPLMDLAELNLRHWRSSSDQVNILHVARVPILFGRGVDLGQLVVGPAVMISSGEEFSDMKYVEITGAAIKAGADDLEDIEEKMALYGLQQLIPRTGNITATEKAITTGESQSSLGTWATEFEGSLVAALTILQAFRGQEFPANGVTVNKEFTLGIANEAELNALLKANSQGIYSNQAIFNEFKRRGITDENLAWEDNQDQMTEQGRTEGPTLKGTLFGGTV